MLIVPHKRGLNLFQLLEHRQSCVYIIHIYIQCSSCDIRLYKSRYQPVVNENGLKLIEILFIRIRALNKSEHFFWIQLEIQLDSIELKNCIFSYFYSEFRIEQYS